jgi:hypothetical protein
VKRSWPPGSALSLIIWPLLLEEEVDFEVLWAVVAGGVELALLLLPHPAAASARMAAGATARRGRRLDMT